MNGHPVIRYFWLANTIDRHGPISFAEIQKQWERHYLYEGNALAIRTFHNHRKAIENIFGICIKCDERSNKYYIENRTELHTGRLTSWLLNAFSVSSIIGESRSLGARVQIEEIPSSEHHLTDLLVAMRENRCVEIVYHPYTTPEPFVLTLQPLIVKLYDTRWYLYANKRDDAQIKLYALDRMLECKVLNDGFEYPEDFDPQAYTQNVIGAAVYDDIMPVKIRIRAKGKHAKYMRSLPLHHSQREVETTDKYADFELFVAPTPELYDKLLSYNSHIEVLSPCKVRLAMHDYIMNMSFMYDNNMQRTKIGKAVMLAARKFPQANIDKIKHSLEMQRNISYVDCLDACMLYLEATYGWDYVRSFRLNDHEALAIFQRGETEGIYIFSSEAVRAKLREAEINSIDDIVEVNRNHHHPKTQPWPYDHSLVQTLISYFGVYIKCHYPKEYEIFMAGLNEY